MAQTHIESNGFVANRVVAGTWTLQTIPADAVGLTRNIEVYRADRSADFVTFKHHGDANTFCPPVW